MKISLLKKRFLDELHVFPSSERLVFFQRLCAAYLNLKPHQIVLNYGKEVSASDLSSFEQALIRLKNHEPVQYILRQTSFFGLTFDGQLPFLFCPDKDADNLEFAKCVITNKPTFKQVANNLFSTSLVLTEVF